MTYEEVYQLLKKATGELKILIAVGVYTGLRLGDALRKALYYHAKELGIIQFAKRIIENRR